MQINTRFNEDDRVKVKDSCWVGTVHGHTTYKDKGRALGIIYMVDLDDADRMTFHEEQLEPESELTPAAEAADIDERAKDRHEHWIAEGYKWVHFSTDGEITLHGSTTCSRPGFKELGSPEAHAAIRAWLVKQDKGGS